MTQPTPVPYYSPSPNSENLSHLKTLSICHYVLGGLAMAFSCLFLIHIGFGIWIASGGGQQSSMHWTPVGTAPGNQAPPPAIGYMIATMGCVALIVGWTFGILTIISGKRIAKHHSRIFSMVVAGISCIWFPFGTVLGIFTIIVLSRDSVKKLYDDAASRPVV